MNKLKQSSKKLAVGILGGIVLVIGIICIPYPGPGWLIVFAGLGILATEFAWAQAILDYAKGKYDAWGIWLSHQALWIRVVFWMLTCAVVVVTIWLLDGYGIIAGWLHLDWHWVDSPLPIFVHS